MDIRKSSADIDQHNAEIQENLVHWQRKPALRAEYQRFYRLIATELAGVPEGPILECGSGIGNLKSVLPQAITSDLFPNPWLDRQENIYSLSFPDQSLSGIVLFDVFHHLQYPGTALAEIHRALAPGGRVVIFEPAMGLLGRLVLGAFHHEPLGLQESITCVAPAGFSAPSAGYYAAQGNAWRIFVKGECSSELQRFKPHTVRTFPALPWILTGGFRGPQLCPTWARWAPCAFEKVLTLAPRLFASRLLVVLKQ